VGEVEDLSDNEREEQLRKFWRENWLWIVGGIGLGLGGLAAWQYWQQTKIAAAEQDEASYVAMLDLLSKNDKDAATKKADGLRALHPKSPYADQADLALARFAVDTRDFDVAVKRLRGVADSSRDPELRLIAQARLARVLSEQGRHDDALKLLDVTKAGEFTAVFHEARGDILAAKGDVAGARQAYDAALASSTAAASQSFDRAFVELKRDALPAAATVAAVTPAPATAAPVPAAAAPAPAAVTPAAGAKP
jgi:predicted negative regulator of RcsB-dependent stress response